MVAYCVFVSLETFAAFIRTFIMFKYSKDAVSILIILDTRRPKADGKYPKSANNLSADKEMLFDGETLSPDEWAKLLATRTQYGKVLRSALI